MKRIILSVCLILFSTLIFGQWKHNRSVLANPSSQQLLSQNKYHLQVGTQFWAAGKNFYGNTTFFNPSAQYDLNKKFTLIVGAGAGYTTMNAPVLLSSGELLKGQHQNIKSFFVYSIGQYHMNSKLNINALVSFQQDEWSGLGNQTTRQQYKDILLGFDYKITPGFTFSGQMGISNCHGYNPFMPGYFGSGFYQDSFFGEPVY